MSERFLQSLRAKHQNERIVLTRDSFDLLHIGHINYLKRVASHGDVVVVALARDKDLKARKGRERPIIPFQQRKTVLEAVKYVDYVIPLPTSATRQQNKDATFTVLAGLRPDAFVTPYAQWRSSAERMRSAYGTHLKVISESRIQSTTKIIDTIVKRAHHELGEQHN